MSQKPVLSMSDFERLGSAEDSIKNGVPDERFDLEQNVFKAMAKGTQEFFKNIGESFKIGNESSNIDIMGYHALIGEIDYDSEVKPVRISFDKKVAENPIEGGNWMSDAIYTVSGMIPAMGKGLIEGKGTGATAALGVAALGQAGPQVAIPEEVITVPGAFAVGSTVGSMNYWYKQGAGSLYADLKDEGLDDGIAAPVAHIAGAMYGAIEFAQVDKLFPGAKDTAKQIIVKSVKQRFAEMARAYGVNWVTEVGEEVLQEVIMVTAQDVATEIAGKTNQTIGAMAEKAMTSGWTTAKKSAIPMLLLLSPSAAVESKRIMDDQKAIEQVEQIIEEMEAEAPATTATEEAPVDRESEAQMAVQEALTEQADEAPEGALEALDDEESGATIVDGAVETPTTEAEKAIDQGVAELPEAEQEVLQRISETEEGQRIQQLEETIAGYEETRRNLQAFGQEKNMSKEDIAAEKAAKDELSGINARLMEGSAELKQAVENIHKKNPKMVKVSATGLIKRLFQAKFQGEKQGFRAGRKQGQQEVKSAKEILERRKNRIKGVADMLQLSDAEMKKINKRDIRLMSNYEFKQFIDKLEALAANLSEKRDIKNRITFEIQEKRLKGVQNLQKALKLPVIDRMTTAQLKQFEEALSTAQAEDEFLSVRKLETVKNTELAGIKTVREAKERLAEKLGVPLESVNNINVSPLDKFRFDAALADRNPFYKLLVDETNAVMIDAEQRFLNMEKEVDKLVEKARNSREKSVGDIVAPTDKLVFQWLETPEAKKAAIAEQMTDAELDLAHYLQERFAQFRDYLIKAEVLKKYRLDYITHIRRGFLETWKEDGMMAAFKEVFNKYKEDAAIFQILEDDTQNILPLEKFFQYSMKRSGKLKPSQNVSKAFKSYAQAIMKKQALDKIVPALDIYAYSLSPKAVTPRGLQMNRRLIQFTREWINNKKGRKSSLGGILPQGGVVDIGLRVIDGFITLIDLGLNIPVGLTVSVGEQVVTFVNLGSKKYTTGIARMNSAKGKQIVSENEAFVGKSPWRELVNTADTLGDKFHKAMFLLFETSNVRANKIHLLGSLTKEEWESGKLAPERLADLRREIGRFRAVPGAKSIFGSTAVGSALTKYKTWAMPILRTVIKDSTALIKMIGKGDISKVMQTREFQELFRATLTTALIALAGKGMVDDDDDSFLGEILRKAYRESMSILGAIDPTVLTSVRLAAFLADLAASLKMIVTLEEYKTKEGLKGVGKLKQTVTPKVVKQVIGKDKKKSGWNLK